MEQAIKKAEEGGYINRYGTALSSERAILLDPLFWQALGKAEGWKQDREERRQGVGLVIHKGEWYFYWHDFIDHLSEGKDINSFFEDLLSNLKE